MNRPQPYLDHLAAAVMMRQVILGRTARAIYDWETGQRAPGSMQIAKMAHAYRVPVKELIGAELVTDDCAGLPSRD